MDKRWLASLLSAAAAIAVLPPTAVASHSSTVTVFGDYTTCGGVVADMVNIKLDNGEAHLSEVAYGQARAPYEMTFGRVPSQGIWASAWVRRRDTGQWCGPFRNKVVRQHSRFWDQRMRWQLTK